MDYEKKYNEALKDMRAIYPNLKGDAKLAAEHAFPELAESEDEKIRKTLVNEIKMWDEHYKLFKHVSKEKVLAYFEKLNNFQFDYPGLYFYDGEKLHFQGNPAMEENPYDFAMSQQEKQNEPIDPFDTKLFQDGVKEGRRLEREEIKKEPIPIPDKFSGLKSLMLQYLQSATNCKDDIEIENDTDLWGRKILDYVWKYSEKLIEQNGENEEDNDFIIYHPLKNGKGEYECIPYSFYGSLTSFSEDKDLLDFLRTCFYTEEECNVWIEQQKEDEGYEAIPVESTLEYKLGFKTGKESEKQKEQKPLSTEETELSSIAFLEQLGYTCIPPGTKQEWTEEDKDNLNNIIWLCENCEKGIETTWTPSQATQIKNLIKSLPERFNLQPKQEWSEEDENNLELVIDCIYKFYPDPVMKYKLKEWLKSLRPQHHKWYIKKGHWYVCIVDKPEYGWTKGKVYQSPEDNRIETNYKGDLTNWPDSEPWFRPATREEIPDPQPHWKPSEEQMKALQNAVALTGCDEELTGLYDQLKKL